jgi:spermidine/putrescine-binding protein
MTSGYTLWLGREERRNVRIARDGSLYDVDSWAIPKGSPKQADAYRFIAFASTPERQKVLSENLAYGPTNRQTLRLLASDLASSMPSAESHLERALKVNTAFWVRYGDELEKRFDKWAPAICRQQIDDDDDDYEDQAVCQDVQGNLRTISNANEIQHKDEAPHRH